MTPISTKKGTNNCISIFFGLLVASFFLFSLCYRVDDLTYLYCPEGKHDHEHEHETCSRIDMCQVSTHCSLENWRESKPIRSM